MVDKKFQGHYHIAGNLLKYLLDIYKQFKIDVVTAGTDLDNLPALINYIKTDFRPELFWTTFRYYFENRIREDKNITVITTKDIKKHDLKHYTRPVAFLMDNRIDKKLKKKLDSYIQKKILSDIKKDKLQLFDVHDKIKNRAVFTLMKEKRHSEILEKEIYRINDIIFFQKEINTNKKLLNNFLHHLKKEYKEISIVETFVKSDDWELIETLTKTEFIPIHNAVTLHKFF